MNKRPTIEQLQKLKDSGMIKGFFVKPKKAKPVKQTDLFGNVVKVRKARSKQEYELQIFCVKMFDDLFPEFKEKKKRFHVANQGWKGGEKTGAFLKRMGKTSGVADFILLARRGTYSGVVIDFKSEGETLTTEQEIFFAGAREEGFRCEEVDNKKLFLKVIEEYLGVSPLKKKFPQYMHLN